MEMIEFKVINRAGQLVIIYLFSFDHWLYKNIGDITSGVSSMNALYALHAQDFRIQIIFLLIL
jgi:hypothetical protein